MPRRQKRKLSGKFKSKVALEAIKGEKTVNQLSKEYEVHPNQISQWKKQLIEGLPDLFSKRKEKREEDVQKERDHLYQQIGQLKIEVDWLKKKTDPFYNG